MPAIQNSQYTMQAPDLNYGQLTMPSQRYVHPGAEQSSGSELFQKPVNVTCQHYQQASRKAMKMRYARLNREQVEILEVEYQKSQNWTVD